MASAQVSARKQEHLEAGKRRLEEFRKQKAAARVKKAVPAGQPPAAESVSNDKQLLNGKIHPHDSEGAGIESHSKTSDSVLESQTLPYVDPSVPRSQHSISADPPPTAPEQEQHQIANVSGSMYLINTQFGRHKDEKVGDYGMISREGRYWDMASSDQSNDYGHLRVKDALSYKNDRFNEIPGAKSSYAHGVDVVSSKTFGSTLPQSTSDAIQPTFSSQQYSSEFGQSVHGDSDFNKHLASEWKERKPLYDNLPSLHSVAVEGSHASSEGLNFGDRDSTSQVASQSAAHETYPRRNRPSFLDSLNIPRAASTSGFSESQPQLVPSAVVESPSHDRFGQNGNLESHSDNAYSQVNHIANSFLDQNLYVNHMERNAELPQKPNEDFAALEQHIEDLTQEKFSLQRALEASKTLAESLASENSSLTESYNQQGGVVAQLKSEMESLQAEINALMAEHESIRMQYMNAQMECNAADERAKLLASEVIGLEEKALRLRSNELKLEKELERSNAEVASCRKKMQSLEKERQDLQMTIDALQEEKKLLQSKLRKASTSGRFYHNDQQQAKKNVSTSTDDLEVVRDGTAQLSPTPTPEERDASASSTLDTDNIQLLRQNGAFGFDGSPMVIPSDQIQMIQNINVLLSELKAEKEELTQALVAEISSSSKLKDLNKELSQRLEAQTQRLELLTAQSMEKESVAVMQPANLQIVQENMTYADEGDEVVERVLGWIMKLFPGGPSRRRISKLR